MPKSSSKAAKTTKAAARSTPAAARKTMPVGAITMRELQKISAQTIEALPHPVPIKSGGRTVAMLHPIRRGNDAAWERAMEAIEKARAVRSKEFDARLAAYLGEPVDDE